MSYSDEPSLYLVTTTIEVPVVAKDEDDAERVVYENYASIVSDVLQDYYAAFNLVEIQAYETVEELQENSFLRNITPHGDDYGGQYTCEYYTQVEKEKRKKEKEDKMNKIHSLLDGLDSESLELLKNHFIDNYT